MNISNAFQREALDAQIRIANRQLELVEAKLAQETERFNREEEQRRIQAAMAPQLSKAFGIIPVYDENNNIVDFKINKNKFFSPEVDQLIQGVTERAAAALAGDVSPLAERLFAEEELKLTEAARKNLGPGYETSTPFLEAMNLFERDKQLRLRDLNMADIQQLTTLALQGETTKENISLAKAGAARGFFEPGTTTVPSIPAISNITVPASSAGTALSAAASAYGADVGLLREQIKAQSALDVAEIQAASGLSITDALIGGLGGRAGAGIVDYLISQIPDIFDKDDGKNELDFLVDAGRFFLTPGGLDLPFI
jgi:hypothetical protein